MHKQLKCVCMCVWTTECCLSKIATQAGQILHLRRQEHKWNTNGVLIIIYLRYLDMLIQAKIVKDEPCPCSNKYASITT